MYRNAMVRTLVVVCTGILLPAAVSAQGSATKSAPPAGPAAEVSLRTSSDWVLAAQSLERSARLRAAGDTGVVNDLLGAATAYETAGKLVRARRAAVEGARQALEFGDVFTAANAYVAAARLSLRLRDESSAFTYLDHARQLATSPRLTPGQTRAIMAQVGRI